MACKSPWDLAETQNTETMAELMDALSVVYTKLLELVVRINHLERYCPKSAVDAAREEATCLAETYYHAAETTNCFTSLKKLEEFLEEESAKM